MCLFNFCIFMLWRTGLLDVESGQLVLAGDPKQLGPILRSPFALKYGMGKDEKLFTKLCCTFDIFANKLNDRAVSRSVLLGALDD